jgi:hypothetical protein
MQRAQQGQCMTNKPGISPRFLYGSLRHCCTSPPLLEALFEAKSCIYLRGQAKCSNTETGTLLTPSPNDSRRQPSVRGQVWIVAPGPKEQLFRALLPLLLPLLLLLLLHLRLRLTLC